jgi:hypothetical protein
VKTSRLRAECCSASTPWCVQLQTGWCLQQNNARDDLQVICSSWHFSVFYPAFRVPPMFSWQGPANVINFLRLSYSNKGRWISSSWALEYMRAYGYIITVMYSYAFIAPYTSLNYVLSDLATSAGLSCALPVHAGPCHECQFVTDVTWIPWIFWKQCKWRHTMSHLKCHYFHHNNNNKVEYHHRPIYWHLTRSLRKWPWQDSTGLRLRTNRSSSSILSPRSTSTSSTSFLVLPIGTCFIPIHYTTKIWPCSFLHDPWIAAS